MAKKRPRKGFKRSQKEWEESIAGHIGKAIDNFSFDDFIAIAIGTAAAYRFKNPWHFLTGSVAYKMARSQNLAAGISGTATLGTMGLFAFLPNTERAGEFVDVLTWYANYGTLPGWIYQLWKHFFA